MSKYLRSELFRGYTNVLATNLTCDAPTRRLADEFAIRSLGAVRRLCRVSCDISYHQSRRRPALWPARRRQFHGEFQFAGLDRSQQFSAQLLRIRLQQIV